MNLDQDEYMSDSTDASEDDNKENLYVTEEPKAVNIKVTAQENSSRVKFQPSSSSDASSTKSAASLEKDKIMKVSQAKSKKIPSTKEMVINAIRSIHDRKGVTINAIKKYATEKHDASHQRLVLISKLLKTGTEEGWLEQTSGTGLHSGSRFKFSVEMKKDIEKQEKKALAKEKKETKKKDPLPKKVVKKAADKEVPVKKKKSAEVTTNKSTAMKKKVV